MDASGTPHQLVNPASLAPAVGFAHALTAASGRTIYLGGQTAQRADGSMADTTLIGQFEQAATNLVTVLDHCGARPEHLAQLYVYTTDMATYRSSLRDLGRVYQRHLGRHYPAMALVGVNELFDPAALVELAGVAVVPEG